MANSAPAARPEDEDTEPDVDAGRIREHVAAHLGRLPTTGINGKIVVSSYGEDPERGRKLIPKIVQFAWPGNDVEALIDEITDKTATLDAEPHRNVYMPYALYRPDLPPGSRGTTADVILVTGIVQDFDAKDDSEAHRWEQRLPSPPTIVLETSSSPEPSFQCHYIFEPAVAPNVARELAERLQAVAGGDTGGKDINHVWRVAGTRNKPNRVKVAVGRPLEAQAVKLVVPFEDSHLVDPETLSAALPTAIQSGVTPPIPRSGTQVEISAPDNVDRLPDVNALDEYGVSNRVKTIIVQGRDDLNPKEGDNSRSAWIFDVTCNLVRCEVPDEVIYSVLTDPGFGISDSVLEKGGNAEKYAIKQIRSAHEKVAEDEAQFVRDQNGKIIAKSQHNIRLAVRLLGGSVAFDEFAGRMTLQGIGGVGPALNDIAMTRLWLMVEERFGFLPTKDFFFTVVSDAAHRFAAQKPWGSTSPTSIPIAA